MIGPGLLALLGVVMGAMAAVAAMRGDRGLGLMLAFGGGMLFAVGLSHL